MSKERVKELEEMNEELSIQLSDMLCAVLKLAGVVESKMQEALDAYIEALDEESLEYGVKEILDNIENLKKNKPELFGKK